MVYTIRVQYLTQTLTGKMFVNNFIRTWKTVKTAVQKESKLLRGTDVSSKLNLKKKHITTLFLSYWFQTKSYVHSSRPRSLLHRGVSRRPVTNCT